MSEKRSVKVMIDGKVITLAGYESDEYLQRVAFYLNNKIAELSGSAGYGRLSQDMKSTLLALNIADDYFKAREMAETFEDEMESKDQAAYDVKHELITAQIEIDRLKKELEALKGSDRS